jgi:hypothetical protein
MDGETAFTVGGRSIRLSKDAVERAVRGVRPAPIKKYSVVIQGTRYPIKQAVAAATGQSSAVFIATDAYRILKRLGFEVYSDAGPQIRRALTLNEIGWVRDGPTFGAGPAFQYRVGNMPPGVQALITNFEAPGGNDWKIMRIEDDAQEQWSGSFGSAEEALAVLQKEFGSSIKVEVLVRVDGGTPFSAEVELDTDTLDPANMPAQLSGYFSRLPSGTIADSLNADFLIHTDPKFGGSSHTIWFHDNRIGYRFRMKSVSGLEFVAHKI